MTESLKVGELYRRSRQNSLDSSIGEFTQFFKRFRIDPNRLSPEEMFQVRNYFIELDGLNNYILIEIRLRNSKVLKKRDLKDKRNNKPRIDELKEEIQWRNEQLSFYLEEKSRIEDLLNEI